MYPYNLKWKIAYPNLWITQFLFTRSIVEMQDTIQATEYNIYTYTVKYTCIEYKYVSIHTHQPFEYQRLGRRSMTLYKPIKLVRSHPLMYYIMGSFPSNEFIPLKAYILHVYLGSYFFLNYILACVNTRIQQVSSSNLFQKNRLQYPVP